MNLAPILFCLKIVPDERNRDTSAHSSFVPHVRTLILGEEGETVLSSFAVLLSIGNSFLYPIAYPRPQVPFSPSSTLAFCPQPLVLFGARTVFVFGAASKFYILISLLCARLQESFL